MPPININPYRFQQTYEGLPMQEIGKLFENTEQNYIENQANYNKLTSYLTKIKGNDSDNEYVNQIAKEYADQIAALGTTTQKTKDWSKANAIVMDMATKVAGDRKLDAIKESYANYLDEVKTNQEMVKQGRTPISFSDYASHKNWDDKGKISIYQHDVAPKADYFKTVSSIWETVKPDTDETGFKKSDIPYYLENETTVTNIPKMKALLDNATTAFKTDSAGIQFMKVLRKENPNMTDADVDATVRNYVREMGKMHEFRQSKKGYQQDPEAMIEVKAKQAALIAVSKKKALDDLKAANKSKNLDDEGAHGIVRVTSGYRAADGEAKGVDAGIFSPVVKENLSKTFLAAPVAKENLRLIDGDKDELYKKGIKSVEPIGFNIINTTGDAQFDGAIKAIVTDKDGSQHTAYINIGDRNPVRQQTQTIRDIDHQVRHTANGTPRANVADTSGLISLRDANGNELNVQMGFNIVPTNPNDWKNSKYTIVPVYRDPYSNSEQQWHALTPEQKRRSFIKDTYSMEDLTNETSNMIGISLKPTTYSNKQLSESLPQ